jgi:arabinogalactan oligomer / maltooligosaccharide transport system substrate-binding protein
MKLGKIAAAVSAVALVVSTFSAASPAMADVKNLVVWADKGTIDTIKAQVQAWDASPAGASYTVTLVQKDFSTVRDALKVAVPRGQGPDILAGAAHDWIGNLVDANVLLPIDTQLPSSYKSNFVPGALQALKYKGHYYGIPGWTENIALIRNVKVAKNKLTSINQIKDGELAVPYDATNSDPYHFYPFQTMFGAPVFTTDSHGDWTDTVGMGGSKGIAFAKWLKAKGTSFFDKPADADILCKFIKGNIKYWVTGAWNINAIEQGKAGCTPGLKIGSGYSIDPFPTGPTGIKPKQFLGIRGYLMVASGPGNTTNVAGATLLMKYLATQKVQYDFFSNANKTPANAKALAQAKSDPVVRGFANAANTVPMPNSPAMDKAWSIWGKAQARIIRGLEADPGAAWTTMVSALQTEINKVQ